MTTPENLYLNTTEAVTGIEILDVAEVPTVVVRFTDHPVTEMPAAFDAAFRGIFPVLGAAGITPVGPALSIYRAVPADTATFEVGVPVDRPLATPVTTDSGLRIEGSRLPAARIARTTHTGGYDRLGLAWGAFMQGVATGGGAPDLPFWEVYVTEPTPETDPATLRTDLYTLLAGN